VEYYEMFEHLPEGTNLFRLGLKSRIRNAKKLIERLEKEKKDKEDGLLRLRIQNDKPKK